MKSFLLRETAESRETLFVVGLLTALLTAFYMGRLVFLTFFGSFRGGHAAEPHLHESPWTMRGPLILLAVGSALGGFVAVPQLVEPVFRLGQEPGHSVPWLPLLATVNALVGLAAAFYAYLIYPDLPARVSSALAPLPRLLEAKYYFDYAYDGFTSWLVKASETLLWKGMDTGVIDGAVNGGARLVEALGQRVRLAQTGFVRLYALLILGGAVAILGYMLWT